MRASSVRGLGGNDQAGLGVADFIPTFSSIQEFGQREAFK
ncbi:hypothetical protein SAMN06273572_101834 [Monaibacterium marinum]|uniref:Uncharacterized protein n=1 Tax=Pontivivens marinum TaxID=1690039 RepID=A0A2C9CP59_9RHOB|nr:hypothetical protein SAMN06273572_101834 [Monaibacterium marinum]